MELTPKERKFVEPYLAMRAGAGAGWKAALALGVGVCVASVLVMATAASEWFGPYFLLSLVAGLVVVEQAVNYRDKVRLATILQKYEAGRQQADQATGDGGPDG